MCWHRAGSERENKRGSDVERARERDGGWAREGGRMLPAENGCCNLKPILIHRNDIKVERESERKRERKRAKDSENESR